MPIHPRSRLSFINNFLAYNSYSTKRGNFIAVTKRKSSHFVPINNIKLLQSRIFIVKKKGLDHHDSRNNNNINSIKLHHFSSSNSINITMGSQHNNSTTVPKRYINSNNSNNTKKTMETTVQDIEELHIEALNSLSNTYTDPKTGFMVFTEYAHLKRGKCCGSMCRHCPYGWENVSLRDKKGNLIKRQPKVKSGNVVAIKRLVEQIEASANTVDQNNDSNRNNNNNDEDSLDDPSIIPSCQDSSNTENFCTNTQCNDRQLQNHESSTKRNYHKDPIDIQKSINNQQQVNKKGKGGRSGGTFTSKNVPYTRTGDSGKSILLTGEKRFKDDDVFEAMGTVDELCSVVGTVHSCITTTTTATSRNHNQGSNEDSNHVLPDTVNYGDLSEWLLVIMSRLFDIGSHVAKPLNVQNEYDEGEEDEEDDNNDNNQDTKLFLRDGIGGGFDPVHIDIIEEWIDTLTEELPELTSFILPTGGNASSNLHVARCVCRRAERRVVPLVREGVCDPHVLQYLNRLSDFFFTAARFTNYCEGQEEILYKRFTPGSKQRNRLRVPLQPKDL